MQGPSRYWGSAKQPQTLEGCPDENVADPTVAASPKSSRSFWRSGANPTDPWPTWKSSSASCMITAAEAETMGEELERFDVDAPEILIDGIRHRRVLRCSQTYFAASGPVAVERSLYSTRQDDEHAACPMELRAGVAAGGQTGRLGGGASCTAGHAERDERPDPEEDSAGVGDLAADKSRSPHVHDGDERPKERPDEHDDVPQSPFGEDQRSVQPDQDISTPMRFLIPPGSIPRTMSSDR